MILADALARSPIRTARCLSADGDELRAYDQTPRGRVHSYRSDRLRQEILFSAGSLIADSYAADLAGDRWAPCGGLTTPPRTHDPWRHDAAATYTRDEA
jgi:hypothetical protein